MGSRFQKRIGFPLGRINLSKSGASVSLGVRGAHVTLGRTPRVSVGIPGSGLSWTKALPHGRSQRPGGAVAFIARLLAMLLGLGIGFGLLALFAAYV
jgi:Protein of unknown function (DUF4236)